jgi:hypothetical protein
MAFNGADNPPAIIMSFMFSPSAKRVKQLGFPDNTNIPDLKSCSDLVFLLYYMFCQQTRQNIDPRGKSTIPVPKYFIIPGIETPEVVAVFKHIFQNNNLGYLDPPGKKWDAKSEEGKALIGTLHGAAISFFLLQHKQQFGVKVVRTVSIWHTQRTSRDLSWHMWVEIGDPDVISMTALTLVDQHADYGQTVANGGDLLCMMRMSNEKAQKWASRSKKWQSFTVQSKFSDPAVMGSWGWTTSAPKGESMNGYEVRDVLASYMEKIGINLDFDYEWFSVLWEHTKDWTVGNKKGTVSTLN